MSLMEQQSKMRYRVALVVTVHHVEGDVASKDGSPSWDRVARHVAHQIPERIDLGRGVILSVSDVHLDTD